MRSFNKEFYSNSDLNVFNVVFLDLLTNINNIGIYLLSQKEDYKVVT